MVNVDQQSSPDTVIRLLPNRSATWANTKLLMAAMIFFVMVIALAWAFVGAWVILPFAGFEVGLLAYIMYRVCHSTYRSEVIKISSQSIEVMRGKLPLNSYREIYKFNRAEVHIEIIETENDWHLPDIRIVTDTQSLSIGSFLNLADRKELSRELRNSGLPNCRTHWWKQD
ncbi:MAG: DUF2244 domain-containing protein [Alteromonas sp.]